MMATEQSARTVQPVVLARVGGLPVDAGATAVSQVEGELLNVSRAQQILSGKADALVDRLFAIIPTAPDDVRRALLKAKRRIFAHQDSGLSPDDLVAAQALSQDTCGDLVLWDALVRDLRDAERRLDAVIAIADRSCTDWLKAVAQDQEFLESLAIASPEFTGSILRKQPEGDSLRVLRSLYLYATRAARKTSPFAGFTRVGVAGERGLGRRSAVIATHLLAGMIDRGARLSGSGATLTESPLGTVCSEGHDALIAIPTLQMANGIVFREETVVGAEFAVPHLGVGDRIATGEPRVSRLLEQGILRPVVPWDRLEDPVSVITRDNAAGLGPVRANDLAWLHGVAQNYATTGAAGRVTVMETLRGLAGRVFPDGELGTAPAGLVYEDWETTLEVPNPLRHPAVREDLTALMEQADPWLFRSHLYDLMVARFVAMFGVGATCTDPLGFCMALSVDNDGDLDVLRAVLSDRGASESVRLRRGGLAGGASAVDRHLGVYFQLAASDERDLAAGDHHLVVNNVGSGAGALQARFHRLLGSDYRERVRDQIHSMWTTERVLELEAWANVNTAQHVCSGVLPELQLPGEPRSPHGVDLRRLRLCHDPASDSLFLADGDGPIGLAYLGLTPQHLLTSYFSWLALLADPWSRFPPFGDQHGLMNRGGAVQDVQYFPRDQIGRIVTARASWSVPVDELGSLFGGGDRMTLLRWAAFRSEHGIPREFFVRQRASVRGTTDDARKPIFVDAASPLSLRVLEKWLHPNATEVRVVEALPGGREHHLRDEAGGRRACEFLASLHFPGKAVGHVH